MRTHRPLGGPSGAAALCDAAFLAATLACVAAGAAPAGSSGARPPSTPVSIEVNVAGFEGDFPFSPMCEGCEADVRVWQAAEDPQEGGRSGGLSFAVRAGTGSAGVRGDIPLPGRVDRLRVWVRGDASGRAVSARVRGADGETHVVPMGRIDFAGWRRLEGTLRDAGEHVGGDGDGRIDFPVRLTGLCVDGLGPGSSGVVYFDGASVATSVTPAEQITFALAPSGPHAVLDPGKVEVVLKGSTLLPRQVIADYTWQLADLRGTRLAEGKGSFALPASGAAEQKIGLPMKRLGSQVLAVTAHGSGLPPRRLSLELCVLPPPSRSAVQGSRLGLNISGALNDAERSLVRLSGAGWVRVPVRWGDIEKERGRHVIDPGLEDTVSDLARAGIRVVPALQGENGLYASGEGRLGAWSLWCREMARRWARRYGIHTWEVGCPDARGTDPAAVAGSYAELVAAAGTALQGVDKEATVLVAVPGTGGEAFLGDVLRSAGEGHLGGVCTGFACALPLAGFASGEVFTPSLLRDTQGPRRLLLTTLDASQSAGAPAAEPPLGAACLARALLCGLADPRLDALFLRGLKSEGPGGAVPTGLVRGDLSPLPALAAFRTVAGQVQGMRLRSRTETPHACAYRFEQGRAGLMAFWSRVGETTFALETNQPRVTWVDLMGNVRDISAREGVALVPAGAMPAFVRLPANAPAALEPVLVPPAAPVAARPGRQAATTIRFRRPLAVAEMGVLRVTSPPGWLARMDYPEAARRGGEQPLALVVTPSADTPAGRYSVRVSLELAPGSGDSACLDLPVEVAP